MIHPTIETLRRLGVRQEINQRFCRNRLLGHIRGTGDIDQIRTLQLGGQGPDDVDALDLEQLADRLYADLRLTARHGFSDPRALRGAGRDEPRFWLELSGDTQLFDGLRQVGPAGSAGRRVGISDRFGV